jgi:hypothetical protein
MQAYNQGAILEGKQVGKKKHITKSGKDIGKGKAFKRNIHCTAKGGSTQQQPFLGPMLLYDVPWGRRLERTPCFLLP